ncbi:VC1465 family Xer recombination activation factor [Acidovorax sp. BL-A-41-H1]|uniref:VC1465 family Xer recombination activation factor n=1 Tax=Acidovorax sp. BL-A-41-H1 TaxID=3421102 RepID=UPI003F7A57C6
MNVETCAQFLHITERTLRNWESGKHDIPFSAYKLLRLLTGMELPGPTWEGWCFHSGKLWSPEGHGFTGKDGSHWHLLVSQARLFPEMCRKVSQLEATLRTRTGAEGAARAEPGLQAERSHGAAGEATRHPAAAGGRREAPALDLSLIHIGTSNLNFAANAGSYAMKPIALKVGT